MIIELNGSYEHDQVEYRLFENKYYCIKNWSCIAHCEKMIADSCGYVNDGIFKSHLYKQNTLKYKKQFLKNLGYKISSKKETEINNMLKDYFINI